MLNLLLGSTFLIGAIGILSMIAQTTDEPTRLLEASNSPIWTVLPVRVDGKHQHFERIAPVPDAFPLKFWATKNFKVTGSSSFSYLGKSYDVAGLQSVPRRKVCLDKHGPKIACGQRAFMGLYSSMRAKFVECRVLSTTNSVDKVQCRVGKVDLGDLARQRQSPTL